MARSLTNSIARIAPTPRTLPTEGHFFHNASNRSRTFSPIRAALSARFCFSIISIAAKAAAQATGLPPNVPPRLPSIGASMTSARPVIEDNGRPAAIDLEAIRMSGSIFQCSQAHIFPVRPNPVCTSSAITRMLYLRQMFTRIG